MTDLCVKLKPYVFILLFFLLTFGCQLCPNLGMFTNKFILTSDIPFQHLFEVFVTFHC